MPNACPDTTTTLNHGSFLNYTSAENPRNTNFPFAKVHFQLDFNHFHLKILSPFVRKTLDVFPVSMKPIHLNQWKIQGSEHRENADVSKVIPTVYIYWCVLLNFFSNFKKQQLSYSNLEFRGNFSECFTISEAPKASLQRLKPW